ncbi:MAG: IclR family transcriptional regulator [archaeon]
MNDDRSHPKTEIKATKRSFTIVEKLLEDPSLTVSQLATELDTSKSTVHNHLRTLQNIGYVVKSDDRYEIGLRFLNLGDRARKRYQLYHPGKQEIDELVGAVGERAQLMVEENGDGVYIYQAKADSAIQTDSHIGTTTPMHATAVGKSYLAFLPADERRQILDEIAFEPHTQNTITDRESFERSLEEVREAGVAFNDEERITGMRAIGAPILANDDRVLGAISVSGPTTRMKGERYTEDIPDQVKQAARVIGIRATHQ